MKNLITSIACVMVLLAMLAEFAHGQALYSRIIAADQAVNSFRDVARAEGCISRENERWIKEELARLLDCRPSDVQVSGPSQPVGLGQRMTYTIKAPVGEALALPGFWRIGEEDSRFDYRIRQYVTSAYDGGEAGEGP